MRSAPSAFYDAQQQTLATEEKALESKRSRIAILRVLTLATAGIALYQLRTLPFSQLFLLFAAALAIFLWLVKISLKYNDRLQLVRELLRLIKEENAIAHHQFYHRFNGADLAPAKHPYAGDLDLFGNASLFQFMHRTTSEQGHRLLANWLLEPAPNQTVLLRQDAAKELATNPSWGLQFEAIGNHHPITMASMQQILNWAASPSNYIGKTGWNIVRFLWPTLALGALALHIFDILPSGPFYLLILILFGLGFLFTGRIMPLYRQVDKMANSLKTISAALEWFEQQSFQSQHLLQAKTAIASKHHVNASAAIRELGKILDRFDYRLNPLVFIPLNTFVLWDLQQVWSLEKWKAAYKNEINQWFSTIAELEALNSIGRLDFNHPAWTYPVLSEEAGTFEATALGHPLIPADRCVANDFSTSGRPAIALITGSNMAGKSTFLRSIGINQVLALAGAPVTARQLTVSNMRIMSSMRIADNLEENTSTFYAELTKLKNILEAVNAGEPVFLLLDEILRGTNSQDRQTGSRALIQQLIKKDAAGLLATHDLALTELQKVHPSTITNYHFDVSVEGEELYFDYKLKDGICTSMNASILMKKIGIEM